MHRNSASLWANTIKRRSEALVLTPNNENLLQNILLEGI
jgi:hypothetical protein